MPRIPRDPRAMVAGAVAVWVILIVYMVFPSHRETDDPQDIGPVIEFVDAFIAEHGRCPDFLEFFDGKSRAYIIESGTEDVRAMGGTGKTDYVLRHVDGWQCRYRSWDKTWQPDSSGEMPQEAL